MINLYNSNITDILPEALADDPKVKALGYAISKSMQRMMDYCQNISVYAAIDTMPEKVLDLLAVELNTQYYDDALSIEVKRSLIKNTLVWYMNAGTVASVQEAVTSVFGNGEVEEWFNYDGEPYYFKVRTSNINSTDEMIQQLTDIVSRMQNVRSHLEAVVVEVMQQLQMYSGCVIEVIADSTTIGIDMNTSLPSERVVKLSLRPKTDGDAIFALIDEETYAIENATVNEEPTATTYNFDII